MKARLLFVLALVAASAGRPALAAREIVLEPGEDFLQETASFDGTWEGTIFFDKEALLSSTGTPDTGVKYRFEINGPVVRPFIEQDGKFVEMVPGVFHIAPVETNAVIFATQAESRSWVESTVFTVTQKDAKTLIVQFSRVVNNRQLPLGDKQSKFATRGAGEFSRVTP